MSLTADLAENNKRVIGGSVDPSKRDRALENEQDVIDMTCGACGASQQASGRALGYTCHNCGSAWQVLRCRGCRKASIVLEGTRACPRCGHTHQSTQREKGPRQPSWLTEPDPLSVWLGGVKYLGGHAERDLPVSAAGLLLDRRGIHVRAFAELFSIRWENVRGMDIEGPQDISTRMSMTRLLAVGASTWATRVSYLTIQTSDGDAIFEVDGLGPPELHARLSRVLQGLQRSKRMRAPIPVDRPAPAATNPSDWLKPAVPSEPLADAPLPPPPAAATPTAPPAPAPAAPAASTAPAASAAPSSPATTTSHAPLTIDLTTAETPIEVLVVDALWKLAHLRDEEFLDQGEVHALRARLLAHIPDLTDPTGSGPLLHV